jgi:hypothetical protein
MAQTRNHPKTSFISISAFVALALFVVLGLQSVAVAKPSSSKNTSGRWVKADPDGDGLTNESELKRTRTKPHQADTDRDGLTDGIEVNQTKTNPLKTDTDGDGLSDGDEVNRYKTNPRRTDTDGDGVSDGDEVRAGTDPRKASTPPWIPPIFPPPASDSTPPDTEIGSGPSGTTTSTTASFSFTSSESGSSFECKLDTGSFASCSSPKALTGLSIGTHTFSVRATDAAKNIDATPVTRTWTVAADTPPPPPTATAEAVWETPDVIEADVPVALDGGDSTGVAPLNCTWSFESKSGDVVYDTRNGCEIDFTFESPGTKYVELNVKDATGSIDSDKQSLVVEPTGTEPPPADTTAPETTISSGPAGTTTATSGSFAFSSSESGSSFECKLDTGNFSSCSSPKAVSGLAVGSHTFSVRATDAASNTDATPATRTWTVEATTTPPPADTTAPETTISSGPSGTTTATSGSFAFSSSEAGSSFECKLDTGNFSSCSSPKAVSALAVGSHTFSVRATDAANNADATPATRTWTVEATTTPPPADTTAPETTISSGPSGTTTATSGSFAFSSSEAGSSFQCKLDTASFSACSSPKAVSALAVGSHTFSVRATDAASNTDATPATRTWTVEATTPPPVEEPNNPSNGCVAGATNATSASAVTSAVSSGKNVCVTAAIGDVNFAGLGKKAVTISSEGSGSLGHLEINGTTDLKISSARFRSVTLRDADRTTIENSTIGGTQANRVLDQLIFMPEEVNNVTIRGNDIGWTKADNSGNTGYGCRCYGTLNGLKFVGNKLHDLGGDGFQGVGGSNVVIDRNEIGPIGANPESDEHSDNIQLTFNDSNLQVTNNWIHNQGYFEGKVTGNSGSLYIHGGSTGSLLVENNLIETNQGRTEICGLGTGGTSRSNITIRNNTWLEGGLAFTGFPGFEWDCDSGTGNSIERNIAVDPDGGFAQDGSTSAATIANNLWGQPSLVTLNGERNCTSANCNPSSGPIGYRKPSGVAW